MVEKYRKNKRDACGELLKEVEKRMKDVTLSAPSYRELKLMYMARDLYVPKPGKYKITIEQINEIQSRFSKGLYAYRNNPELKENFEAIDGYMKELKILNVKDSEVKKIKINFCMIMMNFLSNIPPFLFYLSLVIF